MKSIGDFIYFIAKVWTVASTIDKMHYVQNQEAAE